MENKEEINKENRICDIDGQYCKDANCSDCPYDEDEEIIKNGK